ncbi:MAG TPA: hypothetical protein GXX23_03665 [Firmicutes bacterium]|nr:hypothetical protein [Candidatus Fermentithermobacillaceae bacterium]
MSSPWYERLQSIPKPAIYATLILVFLVPLIRPMGLPLLMSENTRKAYEYIDALPEGSIVFHSIAFNPAVDAENWPQMLALVRHYMKNGLKIIFYPTMQEGGMYAERIRSTYAAEYGYEYGEDYVILPFKAGGESAIAGLKDFWSFMPSDVDGTPLKDLPLFQGFTDMRDVDVIVPCTGSSDGLFYVSHLNAAYGTPIIMAGTAPVLPFIGPFLASGQVKGAIIGLSGAAEYEILAGVPGQATGAMDAQSMGHLLIVGLVLIGNLGFLYGKRVNGKNGQNGRRS